MVIKIIDTWHTLCVNLCQSMSDPPTYNNTLTFPTQLFDVGLCPEKLEPLLYPEEVIDFLTIPNSSNLSEQQRNQIFHESEFVMPESLPLIKRPIWNVKFNFFNNSTPTISSSPTSDQDSIGIEKEYKPFWTHLSKELSEKLWSPTKTDCVDSDMTCYHGCSKSLTAKSWFSTQLQTPRRKSNSPKTSCPLSTTLQQKIMECAVPKTEKREILKARKIKLYPSTQEKQTLNQWFGAARWTYNQCVQAFREKAKDETLDKKTLRPRFVNHNTEKPDYVKKVPYDVRDEAMADVLKNVKSNCAKIKKKIIERFRLHFKSRKFPQSVVIRKKHYFNENGMYSFLRRMNKSEYIESREVLHDFRILKDVYGDYWMCLPHEVTLQSERQACKFTLKGIDGVISLDPGVRTFLTGYDGYQECVVHLSTDQKIIRNLFMELDLLESKMSKKRNRKKMRLRKACQRKRKRIRHLIKDMHYKVAQFLCTNYKVILLPKFGTQKMIRRTKRKIGRRTARMMMTLSHYTFQQRLLEKSKEYRNCTVVLVSEAYTSKTCSECGWLHPDLKGSKSYQCQKCGSELDRDVNAAKNILLRNNV